jgi:hypothetical protein
MIGRSGDRVNREAIAPAGFSDHQFIRSPDLPIAPFVRQIIGSPDHPISRSPSLFHGLPEMRPLDATPRKKYDTVAPVLSRDSDGLQKPFRREESRRWIADEPFVNVSQVQDGLTFRLGMGCLGKALECLLKLVLARAHGQLGERGLCQVKNFRAVRSTLTSARYPLVEGCVHLINGVIHFPVQVCRGNSLIELALVHPFFLITRVLSEFL